MERSAGTTQPAPTGPAQMRGVRFQLGACNRGAGTTQPAPTGSAQIRSVCFVFGGFPGVPVWRSPNGNRPLSNPPRTCRRRLVRPGVPEMPDSPGNRPLPSHLRTDDIAWWRASRLGSRDHAERQTLRHSPGLSHTFTDLTSRVGHGLRQPHELAAAGYPYLAGLVPLVVDVHSTSLQVV